jgi:hypothetical protein
MLLLRPAAQNARAADAVSFATVEFADRYG